jgi:AcrR family transcriptional regulator
MDPETVRPLPSARKRRELPPWKDDVDNVRRRTANDAWEFLYTHDWADISFKTLAKKAGVSTPALYRYFPTLSDLARNVCLSALARLHANTVQAFNKAADSPKKTARDVLHDTIAAYWEFARKRPRHFALAFAPEHSADPKVTAARAKIRSSAEETLRIVTGDDSMKVHAEELWTVVHGAAALIAAGQSIEEARLLAFIDSHVVVLDAAPRHS